MESEKKWLYVSLRYSKILNKVILDKDYNFNSKFTIEDKSKVNSLYGDLVYKCNFLIYGNEDKIKELQEKNKNDFYIWVSCNVENQKDLNMHVFNSVNTTNLNKNYGYVNFFEENIDNFKFKIECRSEEDFFNKFFNLCEKSINEENKTLDDLLLEEVIEKINSTEGKFS